MLTPKKKTWGFKRHGSQMARVWLLVLVKQVKGKEEVKEDEDEEGWEDVDEEEEEAAEELISWKTINTSYFGLVLREVTEGRPENQRRFSV